MPKVFGHGTAVTFNASAIGGLLDVVLPEQEAEEVEESDMDSLGVREFRAGLIDSGSIELPCRYIPGDVGQDALVAALGGDAQAVVVQAPGGAGEPEWQFDAFVMGNSGPELYWQSEVAIRTFVLRVTGAITETVQA